MQKPKSSYKDLQDMSEIKVEMVSPKSKHMTTQQIKALEEKLEEAKRMARQATWVAQQVLGEVQAERDHHKLRAEAWQKMAGELAEKLKLCRECTPDGFVANPHRGVNNAHFDIHCEIDAALSRFNTLNQKAS